MDVISHAIAGAASGYMFGHPILGAAIGVLPDLCLIGKRRVHPTPLYRFTHSLGFMLVLLFLSQLLTNSGDIGWTVAVAWASHVYLDVPTHGSVWAVRLLYPNEDVYYEAEEWEFFNNAWKFGFALTIIWSTVCLIMSFAL